MWRKAGNSACVTRLFRGVRVNHWTSDGKDLFSDLPSKREKRNGSLIGLCLRVNTSGGGDFPTPQLEAFVKRARTRNKSRRRLRRKLKRFFCKSQVLTDAFWILPRSGSSTLLSNRFSRFLGLTKSYVIESLCKLVVRKEKLYLRHPSLQGANSYCSPDPMMSMKAQSFGSQSFLQMACNSLLNTGSNGCRVVCSPNNFCTLVYKLERPSVRRLSGRVGKRKRRTFVESQAHRANDCLTASMSARYVAAYLLTSVLRLSIDRYKVISNGTCIPVDRKGHAYEAKQSSIRVTTVGVT